LTDPVELQLSLAGRPADLSAARAFVAHVARAAGVKEELVEDLRLATSEALTSLIESAAGPVLIAAAIDGARLQVTIPATPTSRQLFISRLVAEMLSIEVGGDDSAFRFAAPAQWP
jgi:hypothetical protein